MFNSKHLMIVTVMALGIGAGVFTKMNKPAKAANANEAKQQALANYGKLPLAFEPNRGQSDEAVQYLSRGDGYTLYLTNDGATMLLQNKERKSARLQLQLVGANQQPQTAAQDQLTGKANYLIGNDRAKWHTDIPTYRKVQYREVWPGVDMVWYGNQRQLEYDFVVKPNAATEQIKLRFTGAESLCLNDVGDLILQTKGGEITQPAPVIYQEGAQGRETVAGKYVLTAANEVAFELGAYDASRQLVIDPQLIYATYVGGSEFDRSFGIAVNTQGEAFIAGATSSDDFPVTNRTADPNVEFNDEAAFVAKLNATGTALVYSTLLGASNLDPEGSGATQAHSIAVTSDGKACITGFLINDFNKSQYPVTSNGFQTNGDCGTNQFCLASTRRLMDAFVTMLSASGNSLVYSTFFGGYGPLDPLQNRSNDGGNSIAVDANNRIYITGFTESNTLPIKNGFQTVSRAKRDAFVAVFNPFATTRESSLLYSSYLGGGGVDEGRSIAVDNDRNAYVGGHTSSDNLNTKAPAGQTLPPLRADFQGGVTDGFVAKFDTEASGNASLTYLTYFGGSGTDRVEGVAVDANQRAYLTGSTSSSAASFPLLNAFDSVQNNGEAFVAKLNANGTTMFYSSFLGGTNNTDGFEEGLGIAIDAAGNAYVAGRTSAGVTFPRGVEAPPFAENLDGTGFIAKVAASVSATTTPQLLYGSTFAAQPKALAIDRNGNLYLTGDSSSNLPVTAGAFQSTPNGSSDGFSAKIGSTFADKIGVFRPSDSDFFLRNSNTAGAPDLTVNFGAGTDIPLAGDWDGDGVDEPGHFRPSTGQFLLKKPFQICVQSNCFTVSSTTLFFGQAGDLPVVGDWNGDGIDTVGVYRIVNGIGTWLLSNSPNVHNSMPVADVPQFNFGGAGAKALAGDWNGDGLDTVGVLQSNGFFLITDRLQNFNAAEARWLVISGGSGTPVSGDWDGDGVDTMGFFDAGAFMLRNRNTSGGLNLFFAFGQPGDLPVAGNWNRTP